MDVIKMKNSSVAYKMFFVMYSAFNSIIVWF